MKSFFLAVFFCLFALSLNQAQAQDDRYFNSSKNHSVKKFATKQVKARTYPKRQHRRHRIVPSRSPYLVRHQHRMPIRQAASVIGGRPSGCPSRFCGCALSLNLFGKIIPTLNLAANWLRFPAASAAPGMVAARRGHVFKLVSHVQGNRWVVWDANSGGGRIRIHHRSIAGFRIVNPSRG